jgi:hypothetical protein
MDSTKAVCWVAEWVKNWADWWEAMKAAQTDFLTAETWAVSMGRNWADWRGDERVVRWAEWSGSC